VSVRGKRWWTPRQDFQGAYQDTLQFLKRCKEHNVIAPAPPALFHAWRMDGAWSIEGLQDASRYLRFGYERNPATDETRQTLARLLSVAVKAHFFLAEQAVVVHEPYLFSIPDLAQNGRMRHGLIYPIEERKGNVTVQKTIVVSEWDLGMSASSKPTFPASDRFPVVLPTDPFRWLNLKHWRTLRDETAGQPWFEPQTAPARKAFMDRIQQHTDPATFEWGTLLSYDISLREDVKQVGGMWAKGVRKWFLPTGWDVAAVTDYLDRLAAMSENDRTALRWWGERARPTPPASSNGRRSDS
jgi:hypothetical protein